jgi:uncharacterized metal-binding protein YceD (DUF177 family)
MGGMSDSVRKLRLADLARGPAQVSLCPDAAERAKIAAELGLEGLPALSAEIEVRPWLDGAELRGRFTATVEQICGVTLDPFEQSFTGDIDVRLLPAGSPNALAEEAGGELALDLDAPDPPDVLESEEIDVAHYVVEHLALELDPFPRKPGAEFDYVPDAPTDSPFAALGALKRREP